MKHARRKQFNPINAPALARCFGKAALIHVLTDPDEISPGRRLERGQ